MSVPDEQLLARLRDLSLVDVDALLAGVPSERHAALLDAHAEELADALAAARERARALMAAVAAGPDPLGIGEASAAMRARAGGPAAGARATSRLTARAHECRALARLYDLAAHLVPRLIEVDRRRTSLS
jgi:hypothetical protein